MLTAACSERFVERLPRIIIITALFGLGELLFVDLEEAVFVFFGEPSHGRVADHYVDGLLEPQENVLLNVRHSVATANFLHERGGLLVTQHGKIGPHVPM